MTTSIIKALDRNYFELFNLPVDFNLDQDQLAVAYRHAQAQAHPDKQSEPSSQMLTQSTQINQAYTCLKHADTRAAYILQLHKQDHHLEQSIDDISFLQSALELREQIDEATDISQLETLQVEATTWLTALSREFNLDLESEDWIDARDSVRKLKFMQCIIEDIASAIDRLEDMVDDLFDED